ncbi:PLP-dependent aminotransferase family protein [Pseudarthrobacter sp. J1763]|uniref:MocR-like transcription factor YczR n=1 Tax=Pseudarthrobacter sp. J1763 TaxID=3420445 RepID=UPI003D2A37FC
MPSALAASSLSRLLGIWNHGVSPAYRELAQVIRLLILDGRLPLGTALPSERSLAETLGLSRTTVTAAYAELRREEFIAGPQGGRARTCVPGTLGSSYSATRQNARPPTAKSHRAMGDGGTYLSAAVGLSGAPGLAPPEGVIDLAYASLPASGEVVHRGFAAALTELPALLPGFGYDALGLPALRQAVADYYAAQSVPTDASQLIITSGAQHALNVILRTFAGRGAKVLVDHPSYPNALDAINAAGCRALPVPLAKDPNQGWDVPALEEALAQHKPALAYLVPDFHNPTGRLMTDSQRRRVVRAAAASGTVLVIDETLREVNLDGVSAAPMSSFGTEVLSIGSLSKSHWAGLRVGWIRASSATIQRLAAARTPMDLGGPVVDQLAATHLVRELREPLPARLNQLRRNRDSLMELLAEHLPTWRPERPGGGLTVWCALPGELSTALTVLGPEYGIRLAAGPRFGIGGAFERHLRLPFTLPAEQLREAVLALKEMQARLETAPKLRASLSKSSTQDITERPAAIA